MRVQETHVGKVELFDLYHSSPEPCGELAIDTLIAQVDGLNRWKAALDVGNVACTGGGGAGMI